ncbi:MAG: CHAT domain-containing protein, partial [Verrucomicrobiota bacterium]
MALNYRETLLDNQPVAGLEGEIAERFGPLVEKVKMKRVLILSPTDVINVIPIDRILASRFEGEIRFQVNLRKGHLIGDTVSLEQSDVLLVGNPLYSDSLPLAQIVAEQESGNLSRRSGLPLPNLWVTPLPGALQEVRDLQIFLTEELGGSSEIVVHTLGDATERAFLETCGGKTIIHLATHGLAAPRWGWGSDTAFQDVALAFAGAETTGKLWGLGIYPPGDENGFLDSHEIASGDFSRCELVILSACDT